MIPSCSKVDLTNGAKIDDEELSKDLSNGTSPDEVPVPVEPVDTVDIIQSMELFSGLDLPLMDIPVMDIPATESEAQLQTSQLMTNSVALFNSTYGLTNSQLIDVFDYLDNPEIAYAGTTAAGYVDGIGAVARL